MALLELPVLLVARSTLGTINHTLLSLDALRRRGIPIAGVVLNGPANDENRQAIEAYGDVQVIAAVEPFDAFAGGTCRRRGRFRPGGRPPPAFSSMPSQRRFVPFLSFTGKKRDKVQGCVP